ncbi:MAG: hypothetical protein A3G33_08420 [Omnitrophica bacterium RIFCSPLOWO2_12_FULL_44_17]|uniref:Uncharacterized protein n=1 Tax=Candidatus Danuiimicrobium aquiferis TaxID=1801832 RepID=A0A1G1KX66_9BACT|nr:MAG: hypothetical protein A3B72_03640 [Omnitrophica bacterium RIFCSPHIGHO2_02_FULL_45_28]OGW92046.1 MAG: hypothetical protein A3E74_01915 [Omnitrophica bacterium RIFCSPHIGHO2_12_FULL_44_12]OGW97189.1 MAG: hypothetical protein A3G33_08420 [Omnitrophica bacterium RIFCSPLOWO2_12_FULL_44_17]
MVGEQRGNASTRKQDLKGGFGLVRCSSPECSQVLYEKSQAYWIHAPRKLICSKCENEVVFQGTDFAGNSMHEISYIYSCNSCKEEYFLRIPMDKKYCSVCKTDRYRSRSYHLRAPLPLHDPTNSCIPVVIQKCAA